MHTSHKGRDHPTLKIQSWVEASVTVPAHLRRSATEKLPPNATSATETSGVELDKEFQQRQKKQQ